MSSTISLFSLMPLNNLSNFFPIVSGAIRCCQTDGRTKDRVHRMRHERKESAGGGNFNTTKAQLSPISGENVSSLNSQGRVALCPRCTPAYGNESCLYQISWSKVVCSILYQNFDVKTRNSNNHNHKNMLAHLEDEIAQRIHHDTSNLFHNRHSRVENDLCTACDTGDRGGRCRYPTRFPWPKRCDK